MRAPAVRLRAASTGSALADKSSGPDRATRYGSGRPPRLMTATVPELSGWALPGA